MLTGRGSSAAGVTSHPVSVTYTIANPSGPSAATDTVLHLTAPPDLLNPATVGCAEDPAGFPDCTVGEVPVGGTAEVVLVGQVGANAPSPVVTTGEVGASTFDPDTTNNGATAELRVAWNVPALGPLGLLLLIGLIALAGVRFLLGP